jgi:hypothetical protein
LAPPALPEPLVRFIRRDIHSVLQLEILLLMRERGGQWTPSSIAHELRITDQSASLHLHDLHLRGLLGPPQDGAYGFAPKTAELQGLVDELAACYAATRYTVINLIFSEPGDSARTLAEAFRFRKKRED